MQPLRVDHADRPLAVAEPAPARRRPWPGWLRRALPRLLSVGALLLFLSAAWLAWRLAIGDEPGRAVGEAGHRAAVALGFGLRDVYVVGRQETPADDVRRALAVAPGDSIFAVDLEAARERLLRLGWVGEAHVNRRLPGTIEVRLHERRPFALWQLDGRLALVDRTGAVIQRAGLERFHALPLVVGERAGELAHVIVDLLELQPELSHQVEAAMLVGQRRWNLKLRNGAEVLLPEEDPAGALHRLAALQRSHEILNREVARIDLRLPDRLVVRGLPAGKRRDGDKDT
ncbi:MAG: FtsQ-type POTRA domain-containing protein [Alphaproteobacteria bacterium]|nr:FtsQ-type POTRA domain-containing protein [Alphaproteobacteria bacterium]